MKLIKATSFLLIIFVLSACSSFEDEKNWSYTAGIDSISVEKIEFRSVDFLAHISCGSMCWSGYYFEKSEIGNDIFLKLFVTSDGSPCPAVCVERSFPYKYRVFLPGSYTFHFWRNDSTSIDTTITFN